ncbi:hypothetical protein PO909_030395 [Leuciscus waleckii]
MCVHLKPHLIPSPRCLPSVPQFLISLLSVALQHLGPARCEPDSPVRGDPVAPPLASDPVVPPRPITLTPPPLLLPHPTPIATIELSAPLDYLDQTSPSHHHRFAGSSLLSSPPPLRLRLAPLSLKLCLSPQSFQLHLAPRAPPPWAPLPPLLPRVAWRP